MFGLYARCLLEADNAYAFWFLLGIEKYWGLFTVLILYYHLQPYSLNIFFCSICFQLFCFTDSLIPTNALLYTIILV